MRKKLIWDLGMSNVTQISLPALRLQLEQIIDHLELLADKNENLLAWGKEFGAVLEDEAERLSDLSARVAVAHRENPSFFSPSEMSLSDSKHAMG